MADIKNGCTPESGGFKEAVCVDAGRVYDSCCDRDCLEDLRCYFAPDAQVFWHCTNECFTAEEFIHINCDYPGSWEGTIERLEPLADGYLLVGRVFDKEQSSSHHVVSLIKMQAGKIIRLDEYWGEDGPPPAWRRQKRIGRPIA